MGLIKRKGLEGGLAPYILYFISFLIEMLSANRQWVALLLLIFIHDSVMAQAVQDRIEEVRKSEPVGASQLALRAVLLRRAQVVTPHDQSPIMSLHVPTDIKPSSIILEVRDSSDHGYYMRPSQPCLGKTPCEYQWPAEKMKQIGISLGDLWPIAKVQTRPTDTIFLPVCLCGVNDLAAQDTIEFILIPSRTIHLQYSLKDADGKKIKSEKRKDIAAGMPFYVTFSPVGAVSNTYTLNVKSVTATDGAVERFSDSFTLLWGQ